MKFFTTFSLIFGIIAVISAQTFFSTISDTVKPTTDLFKKIGQKQKVGGAMLADTMQETMNIVAKQAEPLLERVRGLPEVGIDEIKEIFGDPKSLVKGFLGGMGGAMCGSSGKGGRKNNP